MGGGLKSFKPRTPIPNKYVNGGERYAKYVHANNNVVRDAIQTENRNPGASMSADNRMKNGHDIPIT